MSGDTNLRAPAPFIVGVARSGTTLLRLQIDSHPEVAIPPETGLGSAIARLGGRDAEPEELLDALFELPTWHDLGLERHQLAEAFARLSDWSTAEGIRCAYRAYAARHGKGRWGDKTPLHTNYIDVLASLLPEAHFIHLVRDGRDVATSLRGLPFAPEDGGIEAIARHWKTHIARARQHGAEVPHYREVRYEQLVTEPEQTLRDLCEYLSLDFSDSMLEAHERARERLSETSGLLVEDDTVLLLEGGQRLAAMTLKPPAPHRVGRWREELTADEVARFEAVAGATLTALGYERASAVRHPERRARGSKSPDQSGALRILIGTHAFDRTGGTETYVLTVARELHRLGHEPVIVGEEVGAMADFAEAYGLSVVRSLVDLPPACDTIFAQDTIMAAALAERYPDARLVQFAHSDSWDPQMPILMPDSVDAVVVASERVAERIRASAADAPVVRLRQPIDTLRFEDAGPLPERPERALILSNYLRDERLRVLTEAWGAAGVECVQIGAEDAELDVVPAIASADIVVGKARAILEAMSCARAAYVYDQYGGDGWVTPANYPTLEADAFAGLALGRTRSPAELAADLADYDPDMGPTNRELVRRHHGAHRHAAALVEVLRGAAPIRRRAQPPLTEVARLTRSAWHWEQRSHSAEAWARKLEREAGEARRRKAQVERLQGRVAEAQSEVRRLRKLLRTRRVRMALRVGRALDHLRRP